MDNCANAPRWAQDNICDDTLRLLSKAVRKAARLRNVEIARRHVASLARQVAEALDTADYRLMRRESVAGTRALAAIHRAINRHYFTQVGNTITAFFGEPNAANFVPAFVESALHAIDARGAYAEIMPASPQEYAAQILCARPFMQIDLRFKDGSTGTVYKRFWTTRRLDLQLFPASGNVLSLRSLTTNELHRPSHEGPAMQIRDKRGRITLEIYTEYGKRHRDPAEGPAVYERFEDDGRIRCVSKYCVRGLLHRPSDQGPALIETDEDGRVLREVYAEGGTCRSGSDAALLVYGERTNVLEGALANGFR